MKSQQVFYPNVEGKVLRYAFPVMVVLGNPRQENCSQHGICKVYNRKNAPDICPCMHPAKAWLSVTTCGSLRFAFETESMSAETQHKFFSGDFFCVQDAFEFPEDILAVLGSLDMNKEISPGLYPVNRYEGFAEVIFY